MADPLATAQIIFEVSYRIYEQVEQVNVNREQCRCLAERVQTVSKTIQDLVNSHHFPAPPDPNKKGKKPIVVPQNIWNPTSGSSSAPQGGPSDSRYFVDGLKALKETLDDALELVTSFSQRSWFKRVIRAGTDNEKFSGIYARLEGNINQLNLGINVQQLMNKKEEKQAIQRDWVHIQSKQEEILRLNKEAKKEMQQLAVDEEIRHKVLMQQFQSMQYALQQLQQEKKEKPLFSQRIIVPFHEVSIDGLINKGSFGEVYKGRYLEREIAVKMLKGKLTSSEKEEFVREVKIMKQLRSEHVMQLDGVCYEPKVACILMKYMPGGTLSHHLKKAPLTPLQKHQLALDIALGLHYLHNKGIIHRDLKGENILIDGKGSPRIADYGISKAVGRPSIMTIDKKSAALNWLPPEIALHEDNSRYTHETDIYSYGTLLWHIMTGKEPYAGCTKTVIAKKLAQFETETIPQTIPSVYRNLITQCWDKKNANRPNLEEIIRTLRRYSPPTQSAPAPSSAEDHYHAGIGYESYKHYDQARISYEKAAQLNHTKAKTNLAFLYLRGKGGLSQDKQRAHDLFLEAAEGGHTRAMEALGKQLSSGDGVPKNEAQGQYWLSQSHQPKINKKHAGDKT